jgi:hypothetical protein
VDLVELELKRDMERGTAATPTHVLSSLNYGI